jgi:membrane-associated protease RseP (regulator of RpoE activity)
MRMHSFMLFAGLLAGPALASRTQVDEFQWVEDGQVLALHGDGERLVVTQATPAPQRGLQAGDVLVSIEGRPLHGTDALEHAVRDAHGHSVRVQVARDGVVHTLTWTAADYHLFLAPPPPPPPSPAPPAPPPPPSGN